jgi:tetratricopeptide (TPR) repeat protein
MSRLMGLLFVVPYFFAGAIDVHAVCKSVACIQIKQFQNEIQKNPQNFDAFYKLGVIFAASGLYEDAVEMFQKAASLKPANAKARRRLPIQKKLFFWTHRFWRRESIWCIATTR